MVDALGEKNIDNLSTSGKKKAGGCVQKRKNYGKGPLPIVHEKASTVGDEQRPMRGGQRGRVVGN